MFDDKNNLVGVVFLAVCAVVAGVFVWQIVTGNRLTYNGPSWLLWALGAGFFGSLIWSMTQGRSWRRGGMGRSQWPNPTAGRRSWWRRLLGKDD